MTDVKGSERSYSSPLRVQQAAATRRAVLDAARELFLAQGYGATTLDQIAARAGVSKPTVFSAVGNKQTVLSAVRDVAMAGDDEKLSMVERPLAEQIRQEPDAHRAVELLAGLFTGVGRRYAQIDEVLRGAAHGGEPGLRELWQTSEAQRLTGARIWATILLGKGSFRDGVDVDTATDLLWLHMAPDQYHRLVHVRGWSDDRFQRWLVDSLTRLLLPPRSDD
jgi:TetR/AcrR family transcriptional regulator, regulator of autoinduction and epiphytic fitness